MEDNNIKWEAGDIAICIKNSKLSHQSNDKSMDLPPLRLNYEYVVAEVRTCECGSQMLDVGLYQSKDGGVRCRCGALTSPGMHIHWCAAERFVKKRTRSEIMEELEAALEDEEYKVAMELQHELDMIDNGK